MAGVVHIVNSFALPMVNGFSTVPGGASGTDRKFPFLSLWIFDPNVGKLPEILVERGDGSVFGSGRSGE